MATAVAQDALLTAKEVADILRICKATLLRYIKAGKVPAIRVGREWRIKSSDIKRIFKYGITSHGTVQQGK